MILKYVIVSLGINMLYKMLTFWKIVAMENTAIHA